jgi:hypothetical protein
MCLHLFEESAHIDLFTYAHFCFALFFVLIFIIEVEPKKYNLNNPEKIVRHFT